MPEIKRGQLVEHTFHQLTKLGNNLNGFHPYGPTVTWMTVCDTGPARSASELWSLRRVLNLLRNPVIADAKNAHSKTGSGCITPVGTISKFFRHFQGFLKIQVEITRAGKGGEAGAYAPRKNHWNLWQTSCKHTRAVWNLGSLNKRRFAQLFSTNVNLARIQDSFWKLS